MYKIVDIEVKGVSEVYRIANLYDVFTAVCWEPCSVLLQQYI